MQLSKVDLSGTLRVTYIDTGTESWDREINLFPSTSKAVATTAFHDLQWFDFLNGTTKGDTNPGFVFELSTEAIPVLDASEFATTISGMTITPAVVDKYEDDQSVYYNVMMSTSYSGADSSAVTAVGIKYTTTNGTVESAPVIKSNAPKSNAIYTDDSSDLILRDQCDIVVKYTVKVSK